MKDEHKLKVAEHKNSSKVKVRRKLIRGKKKTAGDKLLEIEGRLYGTGWYRMFLDVVYYCYIIITKPLPCC